MVREPQPRRRDACPVRVRDVACGFPPSWSLDQLTIGYGGQEGKGLRSGDFVHVRVSSTPAGFAGVTLNAPSQDMNRTLRPVT